jgi:hypothetical protein
LRNAQLKVDAGDDPTRALDALHSATVMLANVSIPSAELKRVESALKNAKSLLRKWEYSPEASTIRVGIFDSNQTRCNAMATLGIWMFLLLLMAIHLLVHDPEGYEAPLTALMFACGVIPGAVYIHSTYCLRRFEAQRDARRAELTAKSDAEVRQLSAMRETILEARRVAVEAKLAQLLEDNKRLMAVAARPGGIVVHAEALVVAEAEEAAMEKA